MTVRKEIPDLDGLAQRHDGGLGEPLTELAAEAGVSYGTLKSRLIEQGYLHSNSREMRRRKDSGLGWFPVEEIATSRLDQEEPIAAVILRFRERGFPLDERVIEDVTRKAARFRERGEGSRHRVAPITKANKRKAEPARSKAADLCRNKIRGREQDLAHLIIGRERTLSQIAGELRVNPTQLSALLKLDGYLPNVDLRTLHNDRDSQEKPAARVEPSLIDLCRQAIAGREAELARRVIKDGESIRKVAAELEVDPILLSIELKRGGNLPNVNLRRYQTWKRTQGE